MSDTVDGFRDMKDLKAAERKNIGIACPVCKVRLPRANPKILLPGQLCRAHNPHYRDPRAELTADEWNAAMAGSPFIKSNGA